MSSYTLSQFNPNEDLPADFMLIMYGMRRSGKTTALLYMMEQMKQRFKFHKVHVFSGTANENPVQWKNFPPGFVTADISNIDVSIGTILHEQQEMMREEVKRQLFDRRIGGKGKMGGIRKEDNGHASMTLQMKDVQPLRAKPEVQNDTVAYRQEIESSNQFTGELTDSQINELRRAGKIDEKRFQRRLIILDDVVNENSIRHSANLNKLAVAGRHIFITCIILSQGISGSASVPPIIRRNSDYIMVVGNPRSAVERKLLAIDYLTISNSYGASENALRILADVTKKKYRIFVIDVTNSTATEYNQFLFQYGPVPNPESGGSKVKFGTKDQWEFKLHHGDREAKFRDKDKNKKPSKALGRMMRVKPFYASGAAAANAGADNIDPFAVNEFFDPLF